MSTNAEHLPGTGEVARRLAEDLGRPLSEGAVQQILRRRPEISPPVMNRRRRWRPQDVTALRVYLESRIGGRA